MSRARSKTPSRSLQRISVDTRLAQRYNGWVTSLQSVNRHALRIVLTLVASATLVTFGAAQDQLTSQNPPHDDGATDDAEPGATQRLDVGFDLYDSPEGRVMRAGVNYNWTPSEDYSFAATVPVINAGLADVEGSGIGDLLLRFNWMPALTLTADPWVPNNLGIGVGLLVPTGDAAKGTGGDQWAIAPSFGWAAKLAKRTTILPQLQYIISFSEGELAQGTETISLSADLIHVTLSKFWIQYTPTGSYDLEAEQYEFDNLLVLGQQVSRRIALRLELRTLNVADPQDPTGDGRDLDYRATLKLQWILAF